MPILYGEDAKEILKELTKPDLGKEKRKLAQQLLENAMIKGRQHEIEHGFNEDKLTIDTIIQYKELLSSLLNCINDENITYHEKCGICYSAKLALNIKRAEKMIKIGEYDSLDDMYVGR